MDNLLTTQSPSVILVFKRFDWLTILLLTDYTVSHIAPVGGTQVVHKEGPTVVEDSGAPKHTAVPLVEDCIRATDRHTEGVVHGGHLLLV